LEGELSGLIPSRGKGETEVSYAIFRMDVDEVWEEEI
jgi:hypothetical protein